MRSSRVRGRPVRRIDGEAGEEGGRAPSSQLCRPIGGEGPARSDRAGASLSALSASLRPMISKIRCGALLPDDHDPDRPSRSSTASAGEKAPSPRPPAPACHRACSPIPAAARQIDRIADHRIALGDVGGRYCRRSPRRLAMPMRIDIAGRPCLRPDQLRPGAVGHPAPGKLGDLLERGETGKPGLRLGGDEKAAPRNAIKASPIYLSMIPSCRRIGADHDGER